MPFTKQHLTPGRGNPQRWKVLFHILLSPQLCLRVLADLHSAWRSALQASDSRVSALLPPFWSSPTLHYERGQLEEFLIGISQSACAPCLLWGAYMRAYMCSSRYHPRCGSGSVESLTKRRKTVLDKLVEWSK